MDDSKITLTIGKQKNIALIAHDGKKAEIIAWCEEHKEELKKHFLCGTGTTARMITDRKTFHQVCRKGTHICFIAVTYNDTLFCHFNPSLNRHPTNAKKMQMVKCSFSPLSVK